jgi:hypothetical protein
VKLPVELVLGSFVGIVALAASCSDRYSVTTGCDSTAGCPFAFECENKVCVNRHCRDHVWDSDETDVDCGGPTCAPCAVGRSCEEPRDCQSGICGRPMTFGFGCGSSVGGTGTSGLWCMAPDASSAGLVDASTPRPVDAAMAPPTIDLSVDDVALDLALPDAPADDGDGGDGFPPNDAGVDLATAD